MAAPGLYGDTPFKRHLSFFDPGGTGVVRPYQTLRSALSLGLSLPAACAYTARLHWRFGNVGALGLGGIEVAAVPARKERPQLQNVVLRKAPAGGEGLLEGFTRPALMKLARGYSVVQRLRVYGFWLLAADGEGVVSRADLELFQRGELLPALQRRRRVGAEHRIPFSRGGPLIVSGHSWVVRKLFDVQVYQDPKKEE